MGEIQTVLGIFAGFNQLDTAQNSSFLECVGVTDGAGSSVSVASLSVPGSTNFFT